jgi:hypothetical protein
MREVDLQAQMVKDAVKQGGHAFKASNRFLVGVVDLSVQMPEYRHCYIEVKYDRRQLNPQSNKLDVPHGLTVLQRKFLSDYQKAGGVGGWFYICNGKKRGEYFAWATTQLPSIIEPRFDLIECPFYVKTVGGQWPMTDIVDGFNKELR